MKDLSRKAMERRKFLKLASSLLAVPMGGYSGLLKAQDLDGQKPLRLLVLPESYGLALDARNRTFISSSANDYALEASHLGTTLQPLSGYIDQMSIISNLAHPRATGVGGNNGHDSVNGHVLCGSKYIDNGSHATATMDHESVDIAIANYLEESGNLSSNRLYSHLFFTNSESRGRQTICYDTNGNQIRSLAGVSSIVDTVVGNLGGGEDLSLESASLRAQQNALDLVSKNVGTLKQRLSNNNFDIKLDAFNTGVIELADQLQERISSAGCIVPDATSSLSDTSTENIFTLIAQTFACDSVTSLTYQIGNELINNMTHTHLQSNNELDAVNAALGDRLHNISHDSSEISDRVHELVRQDQATEIAKFLDTLSTTPDVNGTDMIIDNTLIFMPSTLAHNNHQFENLPMVVIAGKNTNIIGGYHYDGEDKTTNDLLTTVAQGLYIPFDRYGGYNETGYINASNTGPIDRMLKNVIS